VVVLCVLLQCRDHALSEHKTLKDFLVDLDGMTIDSPGFKVRQGHTP